jgi:hypothetical protein
MKRGLNIKVVISSGFKRIVGGVIGASHWPQMATI